MAPETLQERPSFFCGRTSRRRHSSTMRNGDIRCVSLLGYSNYVVGTFGKGELAKKRKPILSWPVFFAQDQTRIHVKTLQASIKNGTKPSCGQKWAQVGIRTTCNIRLEGLCWGFNRLRIDMNIGLPAKKLMGGDLGRHDGGYWCQVGAKKGPRSFKIPEKSFKIVAKMVQDRGLEEVWAALGAYRGVLVVSWGVSGVSCSVLGAS